MSNDYIAITTDDHRYEVGDTTTICGDQYEAVFIMSPNSVLLHRIGLRRRLRLAVRELWPFRFAGFWGRVWVR